MLRAQSQCGLQFLPPRRHALRGPRIDKVERGARENFLRRRKGGPRILGAMRAAQFFQCRIVKGLHPQRQPRDAGCAQGFQMRLRGAHRIGLQRHLGARRQTPTRIHRRQNRGDQIGRHERRRAAAEKHRLDRPLRAHRNRMVQFARISGPPNIAVGGMRIAQHMHIEITIGANGGTKRPMHIKPQGRQLRHG